MLCPATSGYWLSLSSFQLASPFGVAIQRVPSRATKISEYYWELVSI